MFSFLKPPPPKEQIPDDEVDRHYLWLRKQVFIGTFIGYAAYYLVRKNFSLAMPHLIDEGFTKAQLAYPLGAVSLAYGLSKFFMGNISDRSNARVFLSLGLLLSAMLNLVFGFCDFATSSITIMFALMFVNGWVQGMGWPPCGRSMVHWFSISERGTRMSIWNIAHNVGGGLIGPFAIVGLIIFQNDWRSAFYFPAMVAMALAFLVYFLMRDTPQSCGLPPIEVYRNEYPKNYSHDFEKEMSASEIFFKHIFRNKFLWYIALANAFVYLVRYGVIDWAPTYLIKVVGYSETKASWAYFFYEYAGIPGTLICGMMSDRVFRGRRAPACFIFMLLVTIALLFYWFNSGKNYWLDCLALSLIGFLVYGPVMLIGVQALDLVPKKAAGTAAGLTGLFGYFIGTFFGNIALGYIIDHVGWDAYFMVLLASCILAMFFVSLTWHSGTIKHKTKI